MFQTRLSDPMFIHFLGEANDDKETCKVNDNQGQKATDR